VQENNIIKLSKISQLTVSTWAEFSTLEVAVVCIPCTQRAV